MFNSQSRCHTVTDMCIVACRGSSISCSRATLDLQAFDEHLNMVLGDVEEKHTTQTTDSSGAVTVKVSCIAGSSAPVELRVCRADHPQLHCASRLLTHCFVTAGRDPRLANAVSAWRLGHSRVATTPNSMRSWNCRADLRHQQVACPSQLDVLLRSHSSIRSGPRESMRSESLLFEADMSLADDSLPSHTTTTGVDYWPHVRLMRAATTDSSFNFITSSIAGLHSKRPHPPTAPHR